MIAVADRGLAVTEWEELPVLDEKIVGTNLKRFSVGISDLVGQWHYVAVSSDGNRPLSSLEICLENDVNQRLRMRILPYN